VLAGAVLVGVGAVPPGASDVDVLLPAVEPQDPTTTSTAAAIPTRALLIPRRLSKIRRLNMVVPSSCTNGKL
jgi:hypothetical protein